ncbi:unnamed protein product [Lasius platythorax]|uniref:Uncharacterized protein n=1 Tax=Lasius platythorax TaxID=488582 RepID=A0AAV2P6P6_9HYME
MHELFRLTNSKKVQRCQYQGASQSSRFNERRTCWKYNENQRGYASSMTRKKYVYRDRNAFGRSRSTC